MKRFKGKTAIIMGADTSIGRATSVRFAKEGANVVLVGLIKESLEKTAEQLPQDNTWIHAENHLTVTCDITQESQVVTMIDHVVRMFDTIDIIVNNAGEIMQDKVNDLSCKDWQTAVDVNLNGTVYVCKAAIPELIKIKGSIINVSSLLSRGKNWNMAAYNAAKKSISSLTQSLAIEHGPHGVRVNAVYPSVTSSNTIPDSQNSSDLTQDFLSHCPLGRFATPDDIAAAITFLASDDAAMITGVNLPIDGGISACIDHTGIK